MPRRLPGWEGGKLEIIAGKEVVERKELRIGPHEGTKAENDNEE